MHFNALENGWTDITIPMCVLISSLSGILCARHSMTTRSMNATQDEDRYGGQGGGAANSG
jgi:hypothetical protein